MRTARVARLATTGPDSRPHLVPIVFGLDGQTLYSAVDAIPEASRRLRRLANARERPDVTVLVDHYEDDWGRLWWVSLRGQARVLDTGEEAERALRMLVDKYEQYRREPPGRPVLAVDILEWRSWDALSNVRGKAPSTVSASSRSLRLARVRVQVGTGPKATPSPCTNSRCGSFLP